MKIVMANGNIVRLTEQHLVYTERGLVRADELSVNDEVFTFASDSSRRTHVLSFSREYEQRYFALNCLESVVLANGIKTSTFGTFHTIPSLWMFLGGHVLGVRHASSIGDFIASICNHLGLI
jgi:hypothetical protein